MYDVIVSLVGVVVVAIIIIVCTLYCVCINICQVDLVNRNINLHGFQCAI